MTSDFERSMEEIQQEIIKEARETYSDKVVEEFFNPVNIGRMPEPDAHGLVQGWCGDTMEFFLRLDGDKITEVSFTTDGCGPTVACGSMLTKMVLGKSLQEASQVRPEDLLDALDGLPEESVHCAELATKALREAIGGRNFLESTELDDK